MNTVIFNDGTNSWDSYTNLNLILTSKVIGSPSTKVETVDIPGGNGVLDFTDFFGEAKYNNRTLTFEFSCINPAATKDSTIKNLLHGKKMKIFLSEDSSSYYFYGRIDVSDWEVDKKIATVTITCDCEPWKYKAAITQCLFSITTSGTATLNNLRKPVVPKITTNAAITLGWTGGSASLSAGTDIIVPELILREGNTSITITGTASVTFKYQEGGF